ncbi:hypothetical protein AABB24_006317, partial [Solanum stoloniferum]
PLLLFFFARNTVAKRPTPPRSSSSRRNPENPSKSENLVQLSYRTHNPSNLIHHVVIPFSPFLEIFKSLSLLALERRREIQILFKFFQRISPKKAPTSPINNPLHSSDGTSF